MSTITHAEYLQFIELFESKTKELLEPMISFFAEGAMDKEEAISFINNAKSMPECPIICGKEKDADYWNSAYIFKTDDKFTVQADDHSGIQDLICDTLDEAMTAAVSIVKQYETI